jgi:hypothetical protein
MWLWLGQGAGKPVGQARAAARPFGPGLVQAGLGAEMDCLRWIRRSGPCFSLCYFLLGTGLGGGQTPPSRGLRTGNGQCMLRRDLYRSHKRSKKILFCTVKMNIPFLTQKMFVIPNYHDSRRIGDLDTTFARGS